MHPPLEVYVHLARSITSERSQMHRCAGELAMHPVGDERRKRREKPARDREDLMQRGKRGAVVLTVHIVETMSALADVPLRHILVEEGHDRLGCVGRFVSLEHPVGLGLYRREPRQNPPVQQWPISRCWIELRW